MLSIAKVLRAIRILIINPRYFLLRISQHASFGRRQRKPALPSYAKYFADSIHARQIEYPLPQISISFSILTTVYEKTSAEFLKEAAQSVLVQTCPSYEWLILAHGTVTESVDKLLVSLEQLPKIQVYRLPLNLGIMGGMRFCLDKASGEYIMPMDADDLITPDALQIMAVSIARAEGPAILYSDEDMLIKGVYTAPYLRPDWDPILNLAGSYIWHLCVFRRDIASKLDVYSDVESNWCHDWDTVFRFANAGYIPLHIPEVLYHWRQHPASSTNRVNPESGSMRSTRHVLEQQIKRQPNCDHYAIEAPATYTGEKEWRIKRHARTGTPMDIILAAGNIRRSLRTLQSILKNTNYPFGSIFICINGEPDDNLRRRFGKCISNALIQNTEIQFVSNISMAGIKIVLSRTTSPLILFCSDSIVVKDESWSWEALKILELHDDVAVVGGRLIKGRRIINSGAVFDENGQLDCMEQNGSTDDPGYFSLFHKPHTVNAVPPDFFVARREFMIRALSVIPPGAPVHDIPMWLGGAAIQEKSRIAFSPSINAIVKGETIGPPVGNVEIDTVHTDFVRLYGNMVQRQQWSCSRFARYKAICQLT